MKHTRVVSTKCTPGFACRAFSDTTLVCFIVNEHTTKCSRYNIHTVLVWFVLLWLHSSTFPFSFPLPITVASIVFLDINDLSITSIIVVAVKSYDHIISTLRNCHKGKIASLCWNESSEDNAQKWQQSVVFRLQCDNMAAYSSPNCQINVWTVI